MDYVSQAEEEFSRASHFRLETLYYRVILTFDFSGIIQLREALPFLISKWPIFFKSMAPLCGYQQKTKIIFDPVPKIFRNK